MHVYLRAMPVDVSMSFAVVRMRMRMNHGTGMTARRREISSDPLGDAGQIQNAQQDEHESDCQLHREPDTRRNYQVEDDNSCTDDEDSDGVADAPEDSDQACVPDALLPADDGGDGDNVIWIGGVAHPQDKTQRDDGQQSHKNGRL